jgi:hypothetical protein
MSILVIDVLQRSLLPSGTDSLLLFVMPPHSPSFVLFYSSTFSIDVSYAFSVTFSLTVLSASLELYLDNARYK